VKDFVVLGVAALQVAALVTVMARLVAGRHRRAPVAPAGADDGPPRVSVVVATLNEARRLSPCLEGLSRQGGSLAEVIVVDSHSTDGTQALVGAVAGRDARFRLVSDPPLPPGWVGKVWALQHGLDLARGEWVLGVDADTQPSPGMVSAVVSAAESFGYDVVSFSPRFAGMTAAEQWLQPSMLLTLVYRFGAAGDGTTPPHRVMANGQCFLARRRVLEAHGGYTLASRSWADDVTLARALAGRGVSVGFLDGSRLYSVRSYEGLGQMWREWGRSFDVRDASTGARHWLDVAMIVLSQGLPLPVLAAWSVGALGVSGIGAALVVFTSAVFVLVRVLMLLALRPSYERVTPGFWLSPLSDPVAALRLLVSSVRRPRRWRGRTYALEASGAPGSTPTTA